MKTLKKLKNKKGFTLIELLTVIAIWNMKVKLNFLYAENSYDKLDKYSINYK